MHPSITLTDVVQRSRDYPDTFKAPSQAKKAKIVPGNFVKLLFEQNGLTERMWVCVTEHRVGTLANTPMLLWGISHGDVVEFNYNNIANIFKGEAEEGDESGNTVNVCGSCNKTL